MKSIGWHHMMNDVVNEFVQVGYLNDGTQSTGVAFFLDGQQQFYIPLESEEEALKLADRFRVIFCAAIKRYLDTTMY